MAKRKQVEEDTADSDGSASGNSSPDEPLPRAKKSKKAESSRQTATTGKDASAKPSTNKEKKPQGERSTVKTNSEGQSYVGLGKSRRATVYMFKGRPLIDIREFYGTEGDEKPSKKGISLTADQWEELKRAAGEIDILLSQLPK